MCVEQKSNNSQLKRPQHMAAQCLAKCECDSVWLESLFCLRIPDTNIMETRKYTHTNADKSCIKNGQRAFTCCRFLWSANVRLGRLNDPLVFTANLMMWGTRSFHLAFSTLFALAFSLFVFSFQQTSKASHPITPKHKLCVVCNWRGGGYIHIVPWLATAWRCNWRRSKILLLLAKKPERW